MNKIVAWVKIVRPAIVFISFFGATTGFLNVTIGVGQDWTLDHTISLILMIMGAGLLGAGLMVHNDYTDLESDKVNRPHKPLCQGIISPNTARWSGLIMMILSVVFATLTTVPFGRGANWFLGVFTVFQVLNGVAYNRWGKYGGILGHISVAIGVGSIPFWGALAARPGFDEWMIMLPLGLAVGTQEVGREIMVCIGDLKGDRVAGFRTTPVRVGRNKALLISVVFYLLSLPVFLFSYFVWWGYPSTGFGYVYLAGAVGFWLVLMITWLDVVRVTRSGDEDRIWKAFERDIRTGTRVAVVAFQVILIVEAFV